VPEVNTGVALRRTTEVAEGTEGCCGDRSCALPLAPPVPGSVPCSQHLVDGHHPPIVV